MTVRTSTFAAALLACALLGGAAARAQEELGDGDDVLWAGDDAWNTPGQLGTDVATIGADDPGGAAPGRPADEWAGDDADRADRGRDDGYLRDAPVEAEQQTTAPRYADFQQGLSPYGDWVQTPEYGRVWRPTQVSSTWRPYADGRWVYTRYGWTWVAEEPFGWAVYHYGRWWYSPAFGWIWVPGRVWAPAWVSWRSGGGNCGWAPLGPRGIVYAEPTRWVFVPTIHFVKPVRTYVIPVHRTYAVWSQVRPLPMQRPGPRAGPPVQTISRAVGHAIQAVPLAVSRSQSGAPRTAQAGGVVHIYRPAGVPFRAAAAAARARTRAGGQPSAPVQRQPSIRSPRSEAPARSEPRASATERKTYSGGVSSPGVIERNRQRREEGRAQREKQKQARREEQKQARREDRQQRREDRPRAEAPRREDRHSSSGGHRPVKKDDRDDKDRNKH